MLRHGFGWKVDKNGPIHPILQSRCWLWTGATTSGYGLLKVGAKTHYLAHRYSYELNVGEIPNGLLVCHHCDNPPCVNPAHFFLGTNVTNSEDRDSKGRQTVRHGEEFTHAKLTDEIVRDIRRRYEARHPKNGARAMAREFGVSHILVRWVISRRIWRHVL